VSSASEKGTVDIDASVCNLSSKESLMTVPSRYLVEVDFCFGVESDGSIGKSTDSKVEPSPLKDEEAGTELNGESDSLALAGFRVLALLFAGGVL
jgi:hypothetical protein